LNSGDEKKFKAEEKLKPCGVLFLDSSLFKCKKDSARL
jgi:hypothetical protein